MFYLTVLLPVIIVQTVASVLIFSFAKFRQYREFFLYLAPIILSVASAVGVLGGVVIAVGSFTLKHFLSGGVFSLSLGAGLFGVFMAYLSKKDKVLFVQENTAIDNENSALDSPKSGVFGINLRNRCWQNSAKTEIDLEEAYDALKTALSVAKTSDDKHVLQNAERLFSLAVKGGAVNKGDLSDAVTSLFKVLATNKWQKQQSAEEKSVK